MATPGQSTNLHKVYSEHGSPMNEYYQAGGEVVAQKMFGNKGRISPAKEATLNTNGGLMYYTYDGLGTVTALHDRHGDKIEDYRYDAFGNLQTGITSPYNLQGYTGHLYDDKSSLVFMNARWYNPSVGRFMSKDTYRGDLAVPQSLNQYAYVMNNPINYVDPTGHIHVYSRDELIDRSRSSLNSLLEQMGEYWWDDYDIFEKTGEWTQKQEDAHANADLIRDVIPYIYEFVRSSSDTSPWQFDGKNEYPDRIETYYSATKTTTNVYQNDFGTKTEESYQSLSKTEIKSASQVAASNQSTIVADYGAVKAAWNNEPTIKLVRTEHKTNLISDKTLVKNTQILTADNNHTNANKDKLIEEVKKGGTLLNKTKKILSEVGGGFLKGVDMTFNVINTPGNVLRSISSDLGTGNTKNFFSNIKDSITGKRQVSTLDLVLSKESQSKMYNKNEALYTFVNLAASTVDPAILYSGIKIGTLKDDIVNSSRRVIEKNLSSNKSSVVESGTQDITTVAKKPIIIGENMKRVKEYAKEIGGHSYSPWKNNPFNFDLGMKRNQRWINDMMKEGREIIDIGPDFSRRNLGRDPSLFYNMERSQVKGYDNYKRVFEREGRLSGGVPGLDR